MDLPLPDADYSMAIIAPTSPRKQKRNDGIMKAKRKSDGKMIEVVEVELTAAYNGVLLYWDYENDVFYSPSELDFNIDEEETIDGWVARNKNGDLFIYTHKPERNFIKSYWMGEISDMTPDNNVFPSLTWESEPLEVTITIKPKKK